MQKIKELKRFTLSIAALAVCFSASAASKDLLPRPVQTVNTEGAFIVTDKMLIIRQDSKACGDLADYLATYLNAWFGTPLPVELAKTGAAAVRMDYLSLAIDSTLTAPDKVRLRMPAEGYILRITPRGIEITGVDYGGLFNGIQTLLQLMPAEIYRCERQNKKINVYCQDITDWPQFGYRGMMLDVARTFTNAQGVKRFIDRLAYHKINRLHWHLTDDEGWRIEIKSYPELAQKAGFRGANLPVKGSYGAWEETYGGYYTQDEIRDVIAYAALRNIEIIPEVELPGHSRAFARIHPEILCPGQPDTSAAGYDTRNVWCATREANYVMLAKILDEICALFPSQYIHIGGDEVLKGQWLGCPTCRKLAVQGKIGPIQDHFSGRLTAILAQHGKKPAVWDEAINGGKLTKNALVYGWQNIQTNIEATAKGYKTVVVPGSYCYLDMKQSPWEPGMTWANVFDTHRTYSLNLRELGFSDGNMANVAGVQGTFFSELLLANGGDDYLYYQCYPRLCAVAEVAWTPEETRNDDDFHDRLYGKHADRMSAMGIRFRLPPPDVRYADGQITAVAHQRYSGITYVEDGKKGERTPGEYRGPIRSDVIEKYHFQARLNDAVSPEVPVTIRYEDVVRAHGTVTREIPLPAIEGLWYLRILRSEPDAMIKSMRIEAADTSYYIIRKEQKVNQLHMMRFAVTPAVRGGKLIVVLENAAELTSKITCFLERSPYIEPKVSVSSTMGQQTKFPLANAGDYNFTSYARTLRNCRKGDTITFTFAEAVDCQSIAVHTGLSYLVRYHVPDGYVEISADGAEFVNAGPLAAGKATIYPAFPVKVLRVVSTASGNGDNSVAVQDLKIIPNYR